MYYLYLKKIAITFRGATQKHTVVGQQPLIYQTIWFDLAEKQSLIRSNNEFITYIIVLLCSKIRSNILKYIAG